MRTLIATAADEPFMPLLRGLIGSLQQWQPQPFKALAVLDLGLAPASRQWVSGFADHVAEPGWDLPVAQPLRDERPYLRALTARPFLPDYFPGYDTYVWMDADTWVQERYALKWYVSAAREGALAVTPQVDRAYRNTSWTLRWRMDRIAAYYGKEAGRQAAWQTYVNSGVFALAAGAPHWQLWQRHFEQGLLAAPQAACCDQSALNHMLWQESPAVHFLPALCNWTCHLATPAYDRVRQRLCEPGLPHRPIGIVHLTGKSKDMRLADAPRESLRFPGA